MRKCPLCECENKTILHRMKNTMVEDIQIRTGYPSEYDIVFCNNCGMVYTDINIKEDNINRYYSTNNMYNNMSDLKSNIYLKMQEMNYLQIYKYIDSDSIVADIGCGSGNLLKYLQIKKRGKLYGIDPSDKSINVLKRKGINGYVGSVYECEKINIPKADMILSTSVLEHLLYPKLALSSMVSIMDDDGYMYICIPATEKYGELKMPEANFFNHEHINHFTENTLSLLAESVGLQIVESCVKRACDDVEFSINMILKKTKANFFTGIMFDVLGKESVESYYKQMATEDTRISNIIYNMIDKKTPVIIWGTGNYAGSILNKFYKIKNNIMFFVDNNKEREGKDFCDKKIYSPKILNNNNYNDVLLIVCVMQAKKEIAEDIKLLGIKNKVIYL